MHTGKSTILRKRKKRALKPIKESALIYTDLPGNNYSNHEL